MLEKMRPLEGFDDGGTGEFGCLREPPTGGVGLCRQGDLSCFSLAKQGYFSRRVALTRCDGLLPNAAGTTLVGTRGRMRQTMF